MSRPVPLVRHFNAVPRHYQEEGIQLELVWSIFDRGETLGWKDLRNAHRAVILADAGAGKTFEMRAQAESLATGGKAAFFIRIEDIDESFGSAFEVGDCDRFEQWLTGTDEAWFFLDSVDEVRLEAPRAFEVAIRAFAARIHDARQRAHVYISSRPYAWRPSLDRMLIEEFLPFEEVIQSQQEGTVDRAARRSQEETSALRVVRLAPLDDDDIRIFAGHRGITDVGAFMDAIERAALFSFARSPFDLEDMIAIWQSTGALDSRLTVLEKGVRQRLRPPIGRRTSLRGDKALAGARCLALAATLTSEGNINLPSGTGPGLVPGALLADFTAEELGELLSRGIFTDAIYGMVRFRHRETRELLAAQFLSDALSHTGQRSVVESLIFRNSYGETVIAPRLRPLLPWMMLFDTQVRDRALALAPETATEGGDSARLPLDIRRGILASIVTGILDGKIRGGDNAEVARIAHLDMAELASALIEAHSDNEDAIFFLGRLVWQGNMKPCVPLLVPIARDTARRKYARVAATRAVAAVGGAQMCRDLWQSFNLSDAQLPRFLLAELLHHAPGDQQSVNLLLKGLEIVAPYARFETSGLTQAVHDFIDRLPMSRDDAPSQPLKILVEGFAELMGRDPFIERRECRVSETFAWLMAPAMHAIERLLVGRSGAALALPSLSIIRRVPAMLSWDDGEARDYKSRLGELVPAWTEFNDALFWHAVESARDELAEEDEPITDDWQVSWMGHFWQFPAARFTKVAEWIALRAGLDDRSVALSLGFRIYVSSGRPRQWRRMLWRAVCGEPALEAKLGRMMRPPASPTRTRFRNRNRKYEARARRREEKTAQWRQRLVATLQANPEVLRVPPGLEPGDMSHNQAWLLRSIEGDGLRMSRRAGARWRTLIPEFGEAVAEAFRDGALRQWRVYRPVLRSEGDESSTIPYALIYAMAGLEIEAGEDGSGLTGLPEHEAVHALRYVPHELNGFPTWFEPLYRSFPHHGLELVWGEIVWELENTTPGKAMHCLVHDVLYHAPWLHREIAPLLLERFFKYGAPGSETLRYGCGILLSAGLAPVDLARLGRCRTLDETTPLEQLSAWFALWVDSDADAAVPVLRARLADLPAAAAKELSERFIISLLGDRREAGPSIGSWRTPVHLSALYELMHLHIRVDEDTVRDNGVMYERGLRDDAQEARGRLFSLLAEIPGQDTYSAILRLASDHPEKDYRGYMRRAAHERAVQDSDIPWDLNAVSHLVRQLKPA